MEEAPGVLVNALVPGGKVLPTLLARHLVQVHHHHLQYTTGHVYKMQYMKEHVCKKERDVDTSKIWSI
jgi:hypothetical protein